MCTYYRPSTTEYLQQRFGLTPPEDHFKPEAFPGYRAPIIRLQAGSADAMECIGANFGLIPPWAEDEKISRHTYNARTETVGEKPSFRGAWKKRQFCLVPMRSFGEPNYESGKAVRWRIHRRDDEDFAVAGIWERWTRGNEPVLSFSMLTINADGHPLMGQFHRPGDERRSLVVIPPSQQLAWLQADSELARSFFSLTELAAFTAEPDPVKKAISATS